MSEQKQNKAKDRKSKKIKKQTSKILFQTEQKDDNDISTSKQNNQPNEKENNFIEQKGYDNNSLSKEEKNKEICKLFILIYIILNNL
jgi:predicted nucleotidyltransferase